jgi:hypothetical protein
VAVDGSGNVAVTGHFLGTTDFGGGLVSSYVHPFMGPTVDIVVANYTASGAYRWARAIGSGGGEEGKGIATDSAGNVLVTGYQGSPWVDYGGGPLGTLGAVDIFVAKYSSAGVWAWSKTIGGDNYDQGNGIAADGADNVFLTGNFGVSSAGVNFGGAALFSAGATDGFIAKYSPTGGHLWSKRFGSTGTDSGIGVGADATGNVYVTGTFEGSVDFGGGSLSSAGMRDIFLIKYISTGQFVWAKRFGGSGDDVAYGLAVDEAGEVALSGKFQSSISFGGASLTSAGGDDAFLVKLDATGAQRWAKRFGSTSGDQSTGVAVDGTNNIVVTGYFTGSVDFGGGALSSAGLDIFAAKYDTSGTHVWSKRFGGASTQIGDGVAAAPNGDVTLTGFFSGTVDFGTGVLTSAGGNDGFIASIGP